MPEVPNTRFINFVDTPAEVQFSQFGDGAVRFDPSTGALIDITGFRKVSVLIAPTTTSASSCQVHMGKLGGRTLAAQYFVALDGHIRTFDVVGPEMSLTLKGGQPNTKEKTQLWVYLRS